MKKNVKIIKKIIYFFVLLFSLTSYGVVKAEDYTIEIDSNGTPGTGGKDPCYEYSYVCIVNYAAIRVTYYNAASNNSISIDFFDNNYGSLPKTKNSITKLHGRFNAASNISENKTVNLGSIPSQFTSKKAQELYENIWAKMKNENSSLFKKIFKYFLTEMGVSNVNVDDVNSLGEYIKAHKNDYIFIEPLYQVKIQKYKDAQNAYPNGKGKFDYYYGTATKVANKVTSYYGNCLSSADSTTCDQIYNSRKEKGHVSRIANGLRLSTTVSIGEINITKVNKAKKNVTRLDTIADDNKGYGIGAIKLSSYYNPPDEKNYSPTCYSYIESSKPATCDENSDQYKNGKKEITFSESTAIDSNATCDQGSEIETGKYKSHSEYGKKMDIAISGAKPKYCALYCQTEESINVNTPTIMNMKRIGSYPASTSSSTEYFENFKIEYENKYNCKIDFVKSYNRQINSAAQSDVTWLFHSIGDSNYSLAQADLYDKLTSYSTCKTMASAVGTSCDEELRALNTVIYDINSDYANCISGNIIESAFGYNSKKPISLKVGSETINLTQSDLIEEGSSCVGCDASPSPTLISQVVGDDSLETVGSNIETNLKTLQNKLLSRGEISYNVHNIYELSNKKTYNFNVQNTSSNNGSDDDYGNVSGDVGEDQICDLKRDALSNKEKSETKEISLIGLGDLADNGQLICKDKIDFSTNIVSECPANTYHAGTNAYYWLANGLVLGLDGMKGYNSAEAIQSFCNNETLPKFEGGYEPILSEDGSTILDDCLMAGIDLKTCNEKKYQYTCQDAKGYTTNITYFVLNEVQKGKSLDQAENYVKNNNPRCTDYCYTNTDNPKNFVYRTISLGDIKTSFPGISGTGRTPGSNWNSSELIQRVITDKKDVYNKDPIYKITLNAATIKRIRNYNNRNSYDDFKLDCDKNGAFCISQFLNDQSILTVGGKCANVSQHTQTDFNGCLN